MNKNNTSNYKCIIAISSFILMATSFSIINSVSTILIAPITIENNFSLSEYSFLFTINAITISIFSPLVGTLINKINKSAAELLKVLADYQSKK